jgi:hypothetical protein
MGLKQPNVMAWHSPKNRVHTAGGRVIIPIDISRTVSNAISSSPAGLIGSAKIGRLEVGGHGSEAEVIYRLDRTSLVSQER